MARKGWALNLNFHISQTVSIIFRVLPSDKSRSKFFTRVSHFWFGFGIGKLFLKVSNFSIFFPSDQKNLIELDQIVPRSRTSLTLNYCGSSQVGLGQGPSLVLPNLILLSCFFCFISNWLSRHAFWSLKSQLILTFPKMQKKTILVT